MTLRVAHVSFYRDPRRRTPEELLRAWTTLGDVATAVAEAGVDVQVVQAADTDQLIRARHVDFHFVCDPAWEMPGGRVTTAAPTRLFECVREMQPQVIHVHGLNFPMTTRWLRMALRGVPVIVQDHGGRPPRGLGARWASIGHRGLRAALFTAREQAEPYRASRILHSETEIFTAPEASTRFTPGDRGDARRLLGVGGHPCIAWVGRLNANKDPLTVLEAFRHAVPLLPDAHLWCCYTDAPLLSAVRTHVESSPLLRGRVHLMGALPPDQVQLLLRASDFLMLGSHTEGSGYAVIEALACGTTPVVTSIPSFARLTDHGRVGSVSIPGDAPSMADGLLRWWNRTAEERYALARAYFEQELSAAAVGRQLRDVYHRLARSG